MLGWICGGADSSRVEAAMTGDPASFTNETNFTSRIESNLQIIC